MTFCLLQEEKPLLLRARILKKSLFLPLEKTATLNKKAMKRFFVFLIRLYRRYISPLKKPCCRFRPTCSVYAIRAIEKHGAFLGLIMAIARILRCNPYNPGGYDPVPEKFTLRSNVGRVNEPSVCETCEKKDVCSREDCSILEETSK